MLEPLHDFLIKRGGTASALTETPCELACYVQVDGLVEYIIAKQVEKDY